MGRATFEREICSSRLPDGRQDKDKMERGDKGG